MSRGPEAKPERLWLWLVLALAALLAVSTLASAQEPAPIASRPIVAGAWAPYPAAVTPATSLGGRPTVSDLKSIQWWRQEFEELHGRLLVSLVANALLVACLAALCGVGVYRRVKATRGRDIPEPPVVLVSAEPPTGPVEHRWNVAVASVKGMVRDANEDCGLAFDIADFQVVVVADGCGGVPHGRLAATIAAGATADAVKDALSRNATASHDLQDAIRTSIDSAEAHLVGEGSRLGVSELRGGLRTTLLVVVANEREFAFGYIGDGGGCVLRASGELESFVVPMKDSASSHLLAASLGPVPHGKPVFGSVARRPGDLLIAGTDGVFDRVDRELCRDVLRACIERNGELDVAARDVLDALSLQRDDKGYVCDDNMTLAIVGDRTPPRVAPGFWRRHETAAPAHHAEPAPV